MKSILTILAILAATPSLAGGNCKFNCNGSAGAFAATQGMSFAGNVGNGEATQETFGSAGQFSSLKGKRTGNGAEITAEVDGFSASGSRGTFSGDALNYGGSQSFNEGFSFGTWD